MNNKKRKIINVLCLLMFSATTLNGCKNVSDKYNATAIVDTTISEDVTASEKTSNSKETGEQLKEQPDGRPEEQEKEAVEENPFTFNPHEYSAKIAESYSEDYWTSFYNLCDALRVGDDTFECASKEIYEWCLDDVTLCQLFPAACMKVTGKSNDGTVPFENGIGRIYYNMPKEDFVKREAEFEECVTKVINDNVKSSYSDFEKCLFLYDYMESNFTYNYDWPYFGDDGADYYCFMNKTGICCELSGVYAYLLRQVGVDAIQFDCSESLDHSWTYVIIDGKGYHIDPTWALKADSPSEELYLDYFMMSQKDREEDDFDFSDTQVGLLPEYFVSQSDKTFPADDETYSCLRYAFLKDIDTDKNTLHYEYGGEIYELKYED